ARVRVRLLLWTAACPVGLPPVRAAGAGVRFPVSRAPEGGRLAGTRGPGQDRRLRPLRPRILGRRVGDHRQAAGRRRSGRQRGGAPVALTNLGRSTPGGGGSRSQSSCPARDRGGRCCRGGGGR